MRLRERTKLIIFPAFNDYNIEIVVSNDVTKSRQKRNAVYGEYVGIFAALHSFNGLGNACIVFSEKNHGLVDVAHECCHAVHAMMDWASVEDQECLAYHMGYLTKQVYDFLVRKKK
jgi:hypothetical protein